MAVLIRMLLVQEEAFLRDKIESDAKSITTYSVIKARVDGTDETPLTKDTVCVCA
jgi:hypothetical protein